MHHPGPAVGNTRIVPRQKERQANYTEDFMNLDDNLFGLDSEGRDMIFGTFQCCNNSET